MDLIHACIYKIQCHFLFLMPYEASLLSETTSVLVLCFAFFLECALSTGGVSAFFAFLLGLPSSTSLYEDSSSLVGRHLFADMDLRLWPGILHLSAVGRHQ